MRLMGRWCRGEILCEQKNNQKPALDSFGVKKYHA
jgi:hypothetical protein